ncbi:MAG: hypothetical protein Q9162_007948 [Coniocarpon cinnabarinum]
MNQVSSGSGGKDAPPWKPGYFRRFPLLGISILLSAAVGIFGCLAVLSASDNLPVGTWSVQPSVYISIIITITNQLIPWALDEGVIIYWWRKVLHDKSSVKDLHRRWHQGDSFRASIFGLNRPTFAALAKSWVTIAVLANAPLIQQSSTVRFRTSTSNVNIVTDAAPVVPNGFTGFVSGRGHEPALLSPRFQEIATQYNNGSAISLNQTGCQGTCRSARLNAVGFQSTCNSTTYSFNLNPDGVETAQGYQVGPATTQGTKVFATSFDWLAEYPGVLNISVQYKNSPACDGNLQIRNCSLTLANVDYPVSVDGEKNTVALEGDTTIFDDFVRSIVDMEDALTPVTGPTTLGGLYLALHNQFNSDANMRFAGAVQYELLSTGALANRFVTPGSINYASSCMITFSDPMQELLAGAREMIFRTAIAAANGTNVQTMTANQTLQQTVYHSDYRYFAGAAAVSLVAILIVLGTFNGFWMIGRQVSMSPVEIAKAFGAPIFADLNSNLTASQIAKAARGQDLKYGVSPLQKLEMGPSSLMQEPTGGRHFN